MPVYTSSPGDSSIGMNLAASSLAGGRSQNRRPPRRRRTKRPSFDAKRSGGLSEASSSSAARSPKNFILRPNLRFRKSTWALGERRDLFPPGDRRTPRHRRPLRRHGPRGDDLGEGRPRKTSRLGRLLYGQHDRPPLANGLRWPSAATPAQAALRPPRPARRRRASLG